MAEKIKKEQASYSAKDIQVLEGLDPVRKRPGMYIGTTGPDGLHHLVWEIINNSIDEAMAGSANYIKVELMHDGGVSVTDNGRGIPVDIHPKTKKSALETALCTLHAGGKFTEGSYKVSGGLHGVGVSVVNALSTKLKAEVWRDGGAYIQEYKIGVQQYNVKKIGKANNTGTRITFYADPTIFSVIEYDLKKILDYLRNQAYLTKSIRIDVVDTRGETPSYYGFYFEGGLLSLLAYLLGDRQPVHNTLFYAQKEVDGIDIETAFAYTGDTDVEELSFANNIYTPDGGTHLTGLRSALTRTLND
ncbi:MAG: ATP-binding protein, partial [Patescibacteria group bacterium]